MKKAFTLVELIITIAVIGVLAAIIIALFPGIISGANERSALSDAVNAQKDYMTSRDAQTEDEIIIVVEKAEDLYLFSYTYLDQKVRNRNMMIPVTEGMDFHEMAHDMINKAQNEGKLTKRPLFRDISGEIDGLSKNVCVFTGACMNDSKQGNDLYLGEGDTWQIEAGHYTLSNDSVASIDDSGVIHAKEKGTSYIYNDSTIVYTLSVYEYIIWDGTDIGFIKSCVEGNMEPVFIGYEFVGHYHPDDRYGTGDELPIVIPKGKTVCFKDVRELGYKAQYEQGTVQSSIEKSFFENYGDLRCLILAPTFYNNSDIGYCIDNKEGASVVISHCEFVVASKIRNAGIMTITDSLVDGILNDTTGSLSISDTEIGSLENRGTLSLTGCSGGKGGHSYIGFNLINSGTVSEIKECEFTTNGYTNYDTEACCISNIINSGTIHSITDCTFSETAMHIREGNTLSFIRNTGTIESITNCSFSYENTHEHCKYSSASGISIEGGNVGKIEKPVFRGAFDTDINITDGVLTEKLDGGTYSKEVPQSLIQSGYHCIFENGVYKIV